MNKLKLVISICVLLCYLCPFKSCGFREDRIVSAVDDSTGIASYEDTRNNDKSENVDEEINYTKSIMRQIAFPTDNSVSGIGLIMQIESEPAEYLILFSFILSIAQLIPFKFSRKPNVRIILQSINAGLVVTSILYSIFVKQDTLLWGFWLLITLLLARLFLETRFSPKMPASSGM